MSVGCEAVSTPECRIEGRCVEACYRANQTRSAVCAEPVLCLGRGVWSLRGVVR